jgi:hypothetical protein
LNQQCEQLRQQQQHAWTTVPVLAAPVSVARLAKSPASALQLQQLLDISSAEAHGALSCPHGSKLLTVAVVSCQKWLGGSCVRWDSSADAAFGFGVCMSSKLLGSVLWQCTTSCISESLC